MQNYGEQPVHETDGLIEDDLDPETEALIEVTTPVPRPRIKGVKLRTFAAPHLAPNGFAWTTKHQFDMNKWEKVSVDRMGNLVMSNSLLEMLFNAGTANGVKRNRIATKGSQKFYLTCQATNATPRLSLVYSVNEGQIHWNNGEGEFQGNPGKLVEALEAVNDFDGLVELYRVFGIPLVFQESVDNREENEVNGVQTPSVRLELAYCYFDGGIAARLIKVEKDPNSQYISSQFLDKEELRGSTVWTGNPKNYWSGWKDKLSWSYAMDWVRGMGIPAISEDAALLIGVLGGMDESMLEKLRAVKNITYTPI